MTRALGLVAFLVILASSGSAQDLPSDTDATPIQSRKAYHYIGIQANQLIRQLLSLGSGSSAVDNPYLINYAVNSAANGAGVNVSIGYTLLETNDEQPTFKRESKDNSLFFRVGFDKKSSLGKRWLLSTGIDLIVENQKDNVKSTSTGGGSLFIQTNDAKTNATGFGPRVGLNFKISEKIFLGTEANYYFKSFKTTTTNSFNSDPSSNTTNTVKFKRFQLSVPAVLYLVIKL